MYLHVLGSGSSGNSYILQNANTALIIDAGISFLEAKKELDFNISKVKGLFLSHQHGDHSKYIKDYLAAGIKCYAHYDTWFQLGLLNHPFAISVKPLKNITLHEFMIMPFELVHDVTCIGFQITHPTTGNVIFMTDTKYSSYTFQNVNNWIVECNHSTDILKAKVSEGSLNISLANRIIENHMSLEYVTEMLKSNDLRLTNKIVLIHASDNNSYVKYFKQRIESEVGKETYVAEKGLKLNFYNEL